MPTGRPPEISGYSAGPAPLLDRCPQVETGPSSPFMDTSPPAMGSRAARSSSAASPTVEGLSSLVPATSASSTKQRVGLLEAVEPLDVELRGSQGRRRLLALDDQDATGLGEGGAHQQVEGHRLHRVEQSAAR